MVKSNSAKTAKSAGETKTQKKEEAGTVNTSHEKPKKNKIKTEEMPEYLL